MQKEKSAFCTQMKSGQYHWVFTCDLPHVCCV